MIATDDRKTLTLGMAGLSPTEVARIRAFMNFCAGRTSYRWHSAPEGAADVWLVGSDECDTVHGALDAPHALVRVLDPGAKTADAPEHVIHRPLQLEDFIDLLARLERRIAAAPDRHRADECWPKTTPVGLDAVAEPIAPMPAAVPAHVRPRPAATVSVRPAPMVPAAVAAPAATATGLPSERSYKLRRWPPQAVLTQDPQYRRLATFLSARSMTLPDLSRLSRVAPELCATFVTAVDHVGITELTWVARAPQPQQRQPAPAPASAPAPAPATATVGRPLPKLPPVAGLRPMPPIQKYAPPPRHVPVAAPPPAPAPSAARAALSLFARIRLRLGIL